MVTWIDVHYLGDDNARYGGEPVNVIWQSHWVSLGAWVAGLPRQIKVPRLAGLLSSKLPTEVAGNQVRRLEGEFSILRTHPLAGEPLGSWTSIAHATYTAVGQTTLPRPDIGLLALVVQEAAMFRYGLRFIQRIEAKPVA